jgi:hypothetical protein
MAIPSSACFDYAVVLSQHSTGSWHGRAKPAANAAVHPGLAGDEPDVELAGGVLTLKRTDASKGNPQDAFRGVPASMLRFRVGRAIEAVAQDGDVLTVLRGGTGDLAATLARGDDFQIGVGAITGLVRRTTSIAIEEDPRAARPTPTTPLRKRTSPVHPDARARAPHRPPDSTSSARGRHRQLPPQ